MAAKTVHLLAALWVCWWAAWTAVSKALTWVVELDWKLGVNVAVRKVSHWAVSKVVWKVWTLADVKAVRWGVKWVEKLDAKSAVTKGSKCCPSYLWCKCYLRVLPQLSIVRCYRT